MIAGVIYYELEENRIATFLRDVQSAEFLKDRRKIYEEYVAVAPSGASLKTRAEEFSKKLNEEADLRSKCDLQWSNIDRLQYALQWSPLHWNLPAKWFPQALVSLWVMTGPYVRHLQEIRLHDAHEYGEKAVRDSIKALVQRRRIGPITIYGKAGSSPVVDFRKHDRDDAPRSGRSVQIVVPAVISDHKAGIELFETWREAALRYVIAAGRRSPFTHDRHRGQFDAMPREI